MSLRVEYPLVQVDGALVVKDEVEILGRLGEPERLFVFVSSCSS